MKKKFNYTILFSYFFAIAATTFAAYQYYAPPRSKNPYNFGVSFQKSKVKVMESDDTLHIAYIGDSWAFRHRNHNCRIAELLEDTLHRPAKVHSYGICGLTSKEIYENMFDNSDLMHFLQKRFYEYCFISAGINDTYKKMSTLYYQRSMDCIIQILLANHIHPLTLEIPDYNIQKSFRFQKPSRKLLRKLSMFINHIPLDCKQIYRQALDELIITKGYQDKVQIIRFQSWNNNYSKDLQRLYKDDGMHLNDDGYAVLDSVIAKEIVTIHKRNIGPY